MVQVNRHTNWVADERAKLRFHRDKVLVDARRDDGSLARFRQACAATSFEGQHLSETRLAKLRSIPGWEDESFEPGPWCQVLGASDVKLEESTARWAHAIFHAHLESVRGTGSSVVEATWLDPSKANEMAGSLAMRTAKAIFDDAGVDVPSEAQARIEAQASSWKSDFEAVASKAPPFAPRFRAKAEERRAHDAVVERFGVASPVAAGATDSDWGVDRNSMGTVLRRVRQVLLLYRLGDTRACAYLRAAVVQPANGNGFDAAAASVELNDTITLAPCK